MLTLAMNINELLADPAQRRHRNGLAIYSTNRSSARLDIAGKYQGLAVLNTHLGQNFPDRIGIVLTGKHGFHLSASFAGTDGIGSHPSAQTGANGIDDDGFSGPGLTGQSDKTTLALDEAVLYNCEVRDAKLKQHNYGKRPASTE
jgi:hypothetical protein